MQRELDRITHRPDLAKGTFETANTAREKSMAAAAATTAEDVLPWGGDRKSEEKRSKVDSTLDPQSRKVRAADNQISEHTQKRLDRLAKKHPEIYEKVKTGQLSLNAAAISTRPGTGESDVSIITHIRDSAHVVLLRHFRPHVVDARAGVRRTRRVGAAGAEAPR